MNHLEEIIKSEEWLKKIASDDSFWSDETMDGWPSIIAYEYRLLRNLCKREKAYGVLFCLKDNFESFLKLEVLLAFAWADRNCDEEFRKRTICQITSPNLTLGAWINLAKMLLQEIEKNGYHLPEELPLKEVVNIYNKLNIVHWRNRKVAHGAMELDEDEDFRKEITKKTGELAQLYKTFDECLRNQQLYTNTAWLIGPDMARGLDTSGKIGCMLQKSGIQFNVDPYILICEVKENGVYFFDNQRTKTKSDFQMYAGGKGLRLPVPYFEQLRRDWDNGTLRLEAEPDDPYLTEAESRELDMLQMSRGFVEPKHLTSWLRDCVGHNEKGIFWLQMERGTGKSIFTEKINRLYKDALVIEEDLDVRTYHFSRSQSAGKYDIYSRIEWLWANDFDSSYSWQQTAGINDYERLDYTPAEAFSWFLDGVREYTEKSRGRRRILMVLDGLDEITENAVWEMLPESEMLQEGVYLLLTSRSPESETGLPQELNGIEDKLMVTERLAIERGNDDNTVFLKEYVKSSNLEKAAKASMESLLEKADHRVLYLGMLCRLCEQGMDIRHISDTGKIVKAYLNMLGQYYEEKEGLRIREVLAVLAILGEYEPLSLKDIAGLTAEGRLTLQLIGMIRDLTPMLKCERSPEGNLYKVANPGLAEELRKQLEEEEIVSGLIDLGIDQIEGGYPPEIPAAEIVIAHLAELIKITANSKKEINKEFLKMFYDFSRIAEKCADTEYDKKRVEDYANQCMSLSMNTLGENHLVTIYCLNLMGHVYGYCLKNYELAVKIYESVFERKRLTLGAEDPDTLWSMCALGVLHHQYDHYEDAVRILEQAFEIQKRVLGEENRATLTTMYYLGSTYTNLEQYKEAKIILEKNLNLRRRTLGENHPDTLDSLNAFALLFDAMGDYEESIRLHKQVLENQKHVLGEEHPETLRTMSNLGCIYGHMGDYIEAVKYLELALVKQTRICGEQNSATLCTMDSLGEVYERTGRYLEAEKIYERVLKIGKGVLNSNDPHLINSKRGLETIKKRVGKHNEIEDYETKYEQIKESKGEYSIDAVEIMNKLSELYEKKKLFDKAEKIVRKVLKIQESNPEFEQSDIMITIDKLGNILFKEGEKEEYLGRPEQAIRFYEESVNILEDKLEKLKLNDNSEIDSILICLESLGETYHRIADCFESLEKIEEVYGYTDKRVYYLEECVKNLDKEHEKQMERYMLQEPEGR